MSDSHKGMCRLCMVMMMNDATFDSGQGCELLFGEHYEVLEHSKDHRWLGIRMWHNKAEGWILRAQHYEISQEYFEQVNHSDYKICTDLSANIFFKKHYLNILIGSIVPISTGELFEIEEQLAFSGHSKGLGDRRDFDFMREIIQKYMYAPYRPGGRSPYGIDDAGLVQQVFRIAGYPLPRFLNQVMAAGQHVPNARALAPGDLLMWDTPGGLKVGINIGDNRAVVVTDSVKIAIIDDNAKTSDMKGWKLAAIRRVLKM